MKLNREIRSFCRAAVDIPYARVARLFILTQGTGEVIVHEGLEIQVVDAIEWLPGPDIQNSPFKWIAHVMPVICQTIKSNRKNYINI